MYRNCLLLPSLLPCLREGLSRLWRQPTCLPYYDAVSVQCYTIPPGGHLKSNINIAKITFHWHDLPDNLSLSNHINLHPHINAWNVRILATQQSTVAPEFAAICPAYKIAFSLLSFTIVTTSPSSLLLIPISHSPTPVTGVLTKLIDLISINIQ